MGDQISRAETAEYLKSALLEAARLSVGKEAELFALIANKAVDEWLNAVPAVDAAPAVHGHWIETTIPANTTGRGGVGQDKKKGILCSECRCAFDISLLWTNDYCPHCGARMDEEG